MKKITAFYSWQSDLPRETNQDGIRFSIKAVIPLIELDIEDINIILDEGTRGVSGSPDITKEIFRKIANSDIFLCDLTPIAEKGIKKIANPNVLIELGYAISELGWERIILLFNTHYGKIPDDLPFDVDKHRTTPFKINNKLDKNGKGQLTQNLKEAIKIIIEKSPKRPHEEKIVNPEVIKRNRDIENLKKILNTIHIKTFDNFIDEAPYFLVYDFLHYYEGFSAMFKSNTFHIHNLDVLDLMKKVYDNLETALSLNFTHHYWMSANSRILKFTYPEDEKGYKLATKDFEILFNNNGQLKKNFNILIKYIKENYLEIDIEETSRLAFEDYLSYQSE